MSPPPMNPLKELVAAGQSPWADFVRRSLISSGELARLRDEDAISGVTSNPSIFGKAIGDSTDYDDASKVVHCATTRVSMSCTQRPVARATASRASRG